MEISDLIKSARIEKGLTQQQLADVVFVTRQTISKWELGKSVPDQASLILLYQYLDIKDNEKKQLSKLIFNKQNIILILIAILFSHMVIWVRFICCKIDKIENRKIKAVIKVIGFVVFSSYLVSLKENVAYLLIGIFSVVYLLYQFYLSGLETKWFVSASLRQAIIHEIQVCIFLKKMYDIKKLRRFKWNHINTGLSMRWFPWSELATPAIRIWNQHINIVHSVHWSAWLWPFTQVIKWFLANPEKRKKL